MSDMTDDAKTYLDDIRRCANGCDPFFPDQDDLPLIDRAIDALTAKSDAELIAWGMTADLNDDGASIHWCNISKAWRLTTLMANESKAEQERLKGNVRYRYLGSKKRPDLNAEDGPEARAILEAAMGGKSE